jgi:hypothetical protein
MIVTLRRRNKKPPSPDYTAFIIIHHSELVQKAKLWLTYQVDSVSQPQETVRKPQNVLNYLCFIRVHFLTRRECEVVTIASSGSVRYNGYRRERDVCDRKRNSLNLGCLHPVACVISYDIGFLIRLRNFNIRCQMSNPKVAIYFSA